MSGHLSNIDEIPTCFEDPDVGHPTSPANDKALLKASLVSINDQGCWIPPECKINLLNKFSPIFKVFKRLINLRPYYFAIICSKILFKLGLYQTSCLFQKSGKISKSELSANWKFFFPEPRVLKIEKNLNSFFSIFFSIFFQDYFFCLLIWSKNFWHQICVQVMRIDNLLLGR